MNVRLLHLLLYFVDHIRVPEGFANIFFLQRQSALYSPHLSSSLFLLLPFIFSSTNLTPVTPDTSVTLVCHPCHPPSPPSTSSPLSPLSPSSPHLSPSLEHHSSFKGKKQICTVYSCCVPFFFLYHSFKHTCLRSLFSCWLLTANKLMPSTDTARSHFIQGALRDIKGVPKKSTF